LHGHWRRRWAAGFSWQPWISHKSKWLRERADVAGQITLLQALLGSVVSQQRLRKNISDIFGGAFSI